jgi:hypothetical protein
MGTRTDAPALTEKKGIEPSSVDLYRGLDTTLCADAAGTSLPSHPIQPIHCMTSVWRDPVLLLLGKSRDYAEPSWLTQLR